MAKVYVGNLDPRATERELEDEFRVFGVLRSVWVARKPPGFAFIEFDDHRDAADAVRSLNGKQGWRVEMSRSAAGGPGSRGRGGEDMKCYECGESGHFARECRARGGPPRGRSRSPPRYRGSPTYGRSPPRGRSPSPPPRRRSPSPPPRRRSPSPRRDSPRRDRDYDRDSPPRRDRDNDRDSPRRDRDFRD